MRTDFLTRVHHEAAGVFYVHNTFAFTRTTSRYHSHYYDRYDSHYYDRYDSHYYDRSDLHDNYMYNQVNYAEVWLYLIGTHYKFLRKLVINTDRRHVSLWL
jgi:hypothetical protein